jgi:hypothetical protein
VRCGALLPLDPDAAIAAVGRTADDAAPDLRHSFVQLDPPRTSVESGTVTVSWRGQVSLPFRRVVALLLPGSAGRVAVDVVAHAQSPLTSAGGC